MLINKIEKDKWATIHKEFNSVLEAGKKFTFGQVNKHYNAKKDTYIRPKTSEAGQSKVDATEADSTMEEEKEGSQENEAVDDEVEV